MDKFLINIFLYLFCLIVFPFLLMEFWSWCMPSIFGLPYLTWKEALGLLLIGAFVFKSSGSIVPKDGSDD